MVEVIHALLVVALVVTTASGEDDPVGGRRRRRNNSDDNREMRFRWRCHNLYMSHVDLLNSLNHDDVFYFPEVKKLFSVYNYYYTKRYKNKSTYSLTNMTTRMPFIVIEGSEASAPGLIARKVAHKINGNYLTNPPEAFYLLLEDFKKSSTRLRAAFTAFCNYAVAEDVARVIHKTPVVLDAYHYKHRAYYLARYALRYNNEKLPDWDEVYKWPEDLLKPDITFWIRPSETSIIRRLEISNVYRYTNATITKLINQAFYMFSDTVITYIDGDLWPKRIISQIVNIVRLMFEDQQ